MIGVVGWFVGCIRWLARYVREIRGLLNTIGGESDKLDIRHVRCEYLAPWSAALTVSSMLKPH